MKRKTVGIVAIIMTVLFCTLFFPLKKAEASDTDTLPTVKVAVLNNSLFAYQDEDGIWRGLDVECMIRIAQRAGFHAEFIDSSADPDFLGNLENGTYDIVADVVKTPERTENYLFTEENIGTSNCTLSVRADDDRWDYGSISQISDMTVGVLRTYANNGDFRSWCSSHKVTPVIKEYEKIDDLAQALASKEIDAELYNAMPEDLENARTIMKFLPEDFYFAFRKSDTDLKNQVDTAMMQILSENSDYLTNLKNKYENQFGANIIPLSLSEKKYVSEKSDVTVAVLPEDEPYYKKTAAGLDGGIIPDYFKLIADYTGLHFRYVSYPTLEDAIKAVKNGDVDVLGLYSSGEVASYQDGISLTDVFDTATVVLVTKAGTDNQSIAAIAVKSDEREVLKEKSGSLLPNAEVKEYETISECMKAMDAGQVSGVVMGLPTATWQLNQTNSAFYSVAPLSGLSIELCASVKTDNETLCSIFNKAITATKSSFSSIIADDTLPENDPRTILARIPTAVMAVIVIILVTLIAVLVWALLMLRRRQKERTAVLAAQAQTRLQRVQIEAMRNAAEQRTSFFSNISHDMRTPLNAITGFIRLARKDDLTESQRNEYLEKAETSSTLLLNLIDDTLTISKANSGKMVLHPQPCRMAELVDAVTVPIRSAAAKKQIELAVDTKNLTPSVLSADRLNIEKIFLNLLSNAVKYTPQGGHIRFTASEGRQEGKVHSYEIRVSDDGIGIDEAFMPHLFEPFAQEKRHGYESVGTGLGLSIVKHLVDLMGGTIEVKSQKNEGTEFTVRLHFEEVPETEDGMTEENAVSPEELAGKKVLLCEDNALNREITVALLKDREMETVTASDGQEGVRKFRESGTNEFDAVLMDLRMPVMNGYEATKEIRSLERTDAATVPIIAMTADAFDEDIRKCLEGGMNGHLSKPIDPEKLYRTLSAHMRRDTNS